MAEAAYILSVVLIAAVVIIVYQFNKLSRLKRQTFAAAPVENRETPQTRQDREGHNNLRPVSQVQTSPDDQVQASPDSQVQTGKDEQEDLKIKLISILAHNCRGALMNILSLTDFYEKGQITKEQFNELTAEMRATSLHDLDTFEKILRWLKTQLKCFECNLLEINASALLKQTIRNNILDINRKKISLTIKDDDENWVVCGDAQLMEFVMNNLVSNAVKYSHPGGEVECVIGHHADRASGMIYLKVIDRGVGMDEKTRARVFCHEKTIYTGTNGEKGSGIALLICKDFVEMQGGELEVRSEPDKGTVFTLVIPGRTGLAKGTPCGDPSRPGGS